MIQCSSKYKDDALKSINSIDKHFIIEAMQKNIIKLNIFELMFSKLFMKCFIRNPKYIYLEKGVKIIKEKLDLVYILRMMLNYNRIKNLIFSKEQRQLFNLVYKEELTFEKTKEMEVDLNDNHCELLSCIKPINSYALSLIKQDLDNPLIDNEKFYKCLDPNVKALLVG